MKPGTEEDLYKNLLNQQEYFQHCVILSSRRLVPELHGAVPAGGGDLARLVRVPQRLNAHVVVRFPLGQQLGRLPVPDVAFAVSVPGDQVAHLGGEVQAAGVARHHVTFENLLADLLEPVANLEQENNDARVCGERKIEDKEKQ